MGHGFGHVLGLDHEANGRLMSSHYTANRQQCIDRAAAEAIAAKRTLPPADLNWCEEPHVARASRGSVTPPPRAHGPTRPPCTPHSLPCLLHYTPPLAP